MKLKLDLWHHLLDIYIYIYSRWCHKSSSLRALWLTLEAKVGRVHFIYVNHTNIINQIPKIRFLRVTIVMSRRKQRATYIPNLKDLSCFMRPGFWKKGVWPTFGCKARQSDPIAMKIKHTANLLNEYIKYQIDISKYVETSLKNSDGLVDWQTDVWANIATT